MSYDYHIDRDFMRAKFIIFFFLIALAAILSTINSWIIQAQFHGGVNLVRAIFQIALAGSILYLLWRKSDAGYILALLYAASSALLYGYELSLYFLFGDFSAKLPTSSVIISLL